MAWIESHAELSRHPKTRKAARSLGVSIPTVLGHLHCLWHEALDLAEDGDLSRWSAEDIATAAMWDEDPQSFVDALVDCAMGDGVGFLERGGPCGDPADGRVGELVIHDWWEYAGRLIARRRADRERKAKERATPPTSKDDDVQRTSKGQSGDAPKDSRLEASYPTNPTRPLTVPDQPTEPNQESNPGALAKRPRKPQKVPAEVWDGLVAVFGEPATKTERSHLAKVGRELADAGATTPEIVGKAREALERWGRPFSPSALAKHWTSLSMRAPPPERSDWASAVAEVRRAMEAKSG